MIRITSVLTILIGLLSACNSSGNGINNIVISKPLACFCENDSLINDFTISCDTTVLTNKTKLYWLFNCDKIWLTLENVNGQKVVIDEVPIEMHPYTFRLGFYPIKEFQKSILFRSGCGATGPCKYTLIDKTTGSKIEEFDQLICIDTEEGKYDFDFIVYLANDSDHLMIYFINSGRRLKVPFKADLSASAFPQSQFDEMILKDNFLSIKYEVRDNVKKTLTINLKDESFEVKALSTESLKTSGVNKNTLLFDIEGDYYFENKEADCKIHLKLYYLNDQLKYTIKTNTRQISSKARISLNEREDGYYITFEDIEWSEYLGVVDPEDENPNEDLPLPQDISGALYANEISIQNSGNSMNYYVLLGECDVKYIHLIREGKRKIPK